jgi:uncharacterized delta-60 repeat protein
MENGRVLRSVKALLLLGAVLAGAASATGAFAQGGTLDPTFGGDGKVITRFAPRGSASVRAIALQSDGKIVAAGWIRAGSAFAILRYQPSGRLDPTFSSDGKVITRFHHGGQAFAVAVQPDGKIVAAGTSEPDSNHEGWFQLVRYLPRGRLDPSFGGGDGKVRKEFSKREDSCSSLTLQADGKIVVAGQRALPHANGAFALMRFNTDGTLDPTFSNDGKVGIQIPGHVFSGAEGLVIQPDGKIVAGGTAFTELQTDFALLRLEADGTRDPGFGTNGTATAHFPSGFQEAWALALGGDGKLVLAGGVEGEHFALARFDSSGALDPSFGGGGLVTTGWGPRVTFANIWAVGIQSDERVVAVGSVEPYFGLARYAVDGTLDPSFSGNGKVKTGFSPSLNLQNPFAMAIQPDARIIAAGDSSEGTHRILLARYLGS